MDKNCLDWAKTYFNDKLSQVTYSDDTQTINVTGVKALEGDCGVYQRKGKIFSLFDMEMTLTYTSVLKDDAEKEEETSSSPSKKVTGEISIPEIAYDSDIDNYQFEISTISGPTNKAKDDTRDLIRKNVIPQLRKMFAGFADDLLKSQGQEFQQNIDEAKKSKTDGSNNAASADKKPVAAEPTKAASETSNKPQEAAATKASDSSSHLKVAEYNTEPAKTEVTLHAPASEVYATFLQVPRVAAWSRSPPVYTPAPSSADDLFPSKDTKFALFGGNISGQFLELDPKKLVIKQTWRLSSWKGNHHATLTLKLVENASEGDTIVHVNFEGIPIGDADEVLENFENYYVRPIKITFGFGAVL